MGLRWALLVIISSFKSMHIKQAVELIGSLLVRKSLLSSHLINNLNKPSTITEHARVQLIGHINPPHIQNIGLIHQLMR